jgi:hypothetical protein
MSENVERLLQRLREQTESGCITWEPTFIGADVVTRLKGPEGEYKLQMGWMALSGGIFLVSVDTEGKVWRTSTSDLPPQAQQELRQLYDAAQRQVSGESEQLRKLLQAVENPEPVRTTGK